jgi:undecaprenyl-diphosphatase
MMIEFWAAVTILGDFRVWLAILVAVTIWSTLSKNAATRKHRRRFLYLFLLSLSVTALVTEVVKQTVHAPRICDSVTNPYCPDDMASFPSGHSSVAWTAFTALWLWQRNDRKWTIVFVLPLLVSFSRIALGVHAYTDVVVGSILGVTISLIAYVFLKKRNRI